MARHSWPKDADHTFRDERNTRRTCPKCGTIQVTRHDGPGFPWKEWFDSDGNRIPGDKTPPCVESEPSQPSRLTGDDHAG